MLRWWRIERNKIMDSWMRLENIRVKKREKTGKRKKVSIRHTDEFIYWLVLFLLLFSPLLPPSLLYSPSTTGCSISCVIAALWYSHTLPIVHAVVSRTWDQNIEYNDCRLYEVIVYGMWQFPLPLHKKCAYYQGSQSNLHSKESCRILIFSISVIDFNSLR